jgi:hypothetical protein
MNPEETEFCGFRAFQLKTPKKAGFQRAIAGRFMFCPPKASIFAG